MARPRPYEVQLTVEFYDLLGAQNFLRRNGFADRVAEAITKRMPAKGGGSAEPINGGGISVKLRNICLTDNTGRELPDQRT